MIANVLVPLETPKFNPCLTQSFDFIHVTGQTYYQQKNQQILTIQTWTESVAYQGHIPHHELEPKKKFTHSNQLQYMFSNI